jgi:hypothetical protein
MGGDSFLLNNALNDFCAKRQNNRALWHFRYQPFRADGFFSFPE